MMLRIRPRTMPPEGGGGMYIWYSPKETANASVIVTLYKCMSCNVSVPPEQKH